MLSKSCESLRGRDPAWTFLSKAVLIHAIEHSVHMYTNSAKRRKDSLKQHIPKIFKISLPLQVPLPVLGVSNL